MPEPIFDPAILAGSALFGGAAALAGRINPKAVARAGRIADGIFGIRQLLFDDTLTRPTELLGGISLAQARDIHRATDNLNYARSNFFIITVEPLVSANLRGPGQAGQSGNTISLPGVTAVGTPAPEINLFATNVSYTPVSISGEKLQIGAASFDNVNGAEAVELRITTLDSADGSLKRWFRSVARRVADRKAGLFGVPADYALKFTILHSVVDGYVPPDDRVLYQTAYAMRPVSMEHELSRESPGMEQVQMTFTEIDTFMSGIR